MAARVCALFLAISGLLACAPAEKAEYSAGDLEPNTRTDTLAGGLHSKLQFLRPLKGFNSREHFVVAVRFAESAASFTLHSHFNGFKHRDGIRIRVSRADGRLKLHLASPGFAAQETDLDPRLVAPDGGLKLRFEVHDGVSSGARVLVWSFTQSLQGEVSNPRTSVGAATADFDSRAEGWVFPTHGRGALWGLETDGCEVLEAYREAPYVL